LAECLEEYLAGKREKNKASTVAEKERLLKRHFSFNGDATKIDDRLVSKALKSIEARSERRHALVEARTFFNWLVKARRIPYSPLAALEVPRKGEDRERCLPTRNWSPFG
jgi:site-specific recombinase XerC